jgi:uncharacterized protein (TIGR02596 family)
MRNVKAFSLIELLVVIAILALLATFLGPAARNIAMGNATTQATQTVTSQLAIARQAAMTRNNTMEVRFYKMADPTRPGETLTDQGSWKVRGMQIFELKPDGSEAALSRMVKLPESAIIDSSENWSTLMKSTNKREATTPISGVQQNYVYYPVRFRSNGSTGLSFAEGKWFLTIHDIQWGDNVANLPNNYTTIQIDPVQGSTKMFRPGVQ